jgi:hypothetical protein
MRMVRDDRATGTAVTVRRASPVDADALAALWRRVPAAGPEGLVWTEHDDWWAAIGAVEGRQVVVAEMEGHVVGASSFGLLDVRFDGRPLRLAVIGPGRMEPSSQGTGVFCAVQGAAAKAMAEVGAEPCALIPVPGPSHRLPRALRRWPTRYERLVIDCSATADDDAAAGRATPHDAEALLVATCAGAALAPVDIGARLRRRLVRDPHGYGAARLLTNGDALLGVGRRAAVVTTEAGRRRRQVTALDVASTSPAALRSLVGAWASRLRDEGADDLLVWACTGTAIHEALLPLASSTTAHAIDLGLTPPQSAARNGISLDPVLL